MSVSFRIEQAHGEGKSTNLSSRDFILHCGTVKNREDDCSLPGFYSFCC